MTYINTMMFTDQRGCVGNMVFGSGTILTGHEDTVHTNPCVVVSYEQSLADGNVLFQQSASGLPNKPQSHVSWYHRYFTYRYSSPDVKHTKSTWITKWKQDIVT